MTATDGTAAERVNRGITALTARSGQLPCRRGKSDGPENEGPARIRAAIETRHLGSTLHIYALGDERSLNKNAFSFCYLA